MLASLLRFRRRAARVDPQSVRLQRPVVSIGNISLGGRGKTPLVGHIARLLVEAGERPAILSRGYGRARVVDGVTVVSDGRVDADGRVDLSRVADVAVSGDEPLMLAETVPGAAVLVCEQRAVAGALAETALGCTVHVLDDGFQHHALRRDVDIVLIAETDLDGRLAPFGRLREPVDALADADAILIDGGNPFAVERVREAWGQRAFVGGMVRTMGTPSGPLSPGAPVVAAAGIAGPERFFASVAGGWHLVEHLTFKDHHRFTEADVRAMQAAAARRHAEAIVVTSKDYVKLRMFPAGAVPIVELPLDVRLEPEGFRDWLLNSLRRDDHLR